MSDVMGATGRRLRLSILTVLTLLAGCLVSVVVTALAGIPAARADTVPAPPAGWTTVFGDDFAGAADVGCNDGATEQRCLHHRRRQALGIARTDDDVGGAQLSRGYIRSQRAACLRDVPAPAVRHRNH